MAEEPLVTALRRHVDVLASSIGPRTALLGDSLDRAKDYVHSAFEEAGLEVAEQAYEFKGSRVANLIATPAGAPQHSTYLVVGAHYDTVPSTPGADDNASAVAVLIELSRLIAANNPTAPVRFVAFTMEELPAFLTRDQGSRVFIRAAQDAGERILGAVVLEMVGYTSGRQAYPPVLRFAGYPDHGRFIGIIANQRSRRFAGAVLTGFRSNERLPVEHLFVPFNGWVLPATRLSDHASFWDARLPAVMVTDTAFFRNPNYHLPTDTADTLDFGFMAELVTSLELAVRELVQFTAL